MKKIAIFALLIALSLTLTGCFNAKEPARETPPENTNTNQAINQNENINQSAGVSQNQNANTNGGVKKFYPSQPALAGGGNTNAAADPERDFVITQELTAKMFLVDKYNPGICYGLPSPVPEVAISGMIGRDPELAQFLKNKYGLKTDLEIYNKMKQLNGINLTKLASGKYQFNFVDGQCCTLKAYEGEINIVGQTISDVINRSETKQNPC